VIQTEKLHVEAAPEVSQKRALYVRNRLWAAVSISWIVLLLFSSTSAAERYCEVALHKAMALVFNATETDHTPAGDHFWAKKATHVVLYVALAGMLVQATGGGTGRVRILVFCIGLTVGIATEFVQAFFPDREPKARDVLINVASTYLGTFLFLRKRVRESGRQ
jgi:VanZ family protein